MVDNTHCMCKVLAHSVDQCRSHKKSNSEIIMCLRKIMSVMKSERKIMMRSSNVCRGDRHIDRMPHGALEAVNSKVIQIGLKRCQCPPRPYGNFSFIWNRHKHSWGERDFRRNFSEINKGRNLKMFQYFL